MQLTGSCGCRDAHKRTVKIYAEKSRRARGQRKRGSPEEVAYRTALLAKANGEKAKRLFEKEGPPIIGWYPRKGIRHPIYGSWEQ